MLYNIKEANGEEDVEDDRTTAVIFHQLDSITSVDHSSPPLLSALPLLVRRYSSVQLVVLRSCTTLVSLSVVT